ncbi:MAG: hypothetical protein ACQEQF_06365 [Bacillota bacterium]
MTDKIYYKVQYPIKKAINVLKEIEPENYENYNFTDEEERKIKNFLENWDESSKLKLEKLIKDLRNA